MKKEEAITILVVENLSMRQRLKEIYEMAQRIKGKIYCIGGPLNDNVKQYNKDQMKDFFDIAGYADGILDESKIREDDDV